MEAENSEEPPLKRSDAMKATKWKKERKLNKIQTL